MVWYILWSLLQVCTGECWIDLLIFHKLPACGWRRIWRGMGINKRRFYDIICWILGAYKFAMLKMWILSVFHFIMILVRFFPLLIHRCDLFMHPVILLLTNVIQICWYQCNQIVLKLGKAMNSHCWEYWWLN